MDTAIRWSPMSTTSEQRFLYIDVAGRSLKLCNVTSYDKSGLKYEVLSTNSKVPPFRAIDWSPVKEGLVAVGQSSGEATVLRIDDDSQDSFLLPIRNQRHCNAVAFNTEGLLATGLDKVRNDFCLNIWDLNQRLSMGTSRGFGADRHSVEPWRKLASSEPITSVKFFKDRPDTLVAGVKGQFVRLYDLREGPGNLALQFPTRCVHNLAIDWLDENYIASCYPSNEPTICIWDRRAGSRISSAPVTSLASTDSGQLSSALDLKNAVDPKGTIWSLRFSRTKRGCLGALSSTGHFKAFDIVKDYVSEEHRSSLEQTLGEGSAQNYPEQIYTKNIRDVKPPFHHATRGSPESQRIVSFDFLNISGTNEPSAITLNGEGKVDILNLQPPPWPISLSSQSLLARGEHGQDLDFKVLGPTMRAGTKISQCVKDIQDRILMDTPLPSAQKARRQSQSNGITESQAVVKDETTQIGSREIRERSLTAGTWGRRLSVDEALTLMAVAPLRCKEGYLFDGEKNKHIVSDDRCLQGFWDWLSRARLNSSDESMVFKGLDMNYLGVFGVWNNDLGQVSRRGKLGANGNQPLDIPNIVKGLVHRLEIPEAKGCDTDYPEHRQLCLRICASIETDEHLENVVKELVSQRRHTKAAALAVFQDETRLAYLALRTNEPTQAHKLLAMAIAGASKGETDSDWEETCAEIAKELTDPYARAILALVSKGDWKEVIQETTLPLKYRAEVALRWLPDEDLSQYLLDATRNAIRQGDIEGVVLTGLGTAAMDLFQSYISKFNDVQTPVLAMSHTVPRFVTDSSNQLRFEAWRETYRLQMNSWKLHLDRARFDVMSRKFAVTWDGRKLTKPPHQQVSLICTYCTRPLSQSEASSAPQSNDSSTGIGGGETTHPTTGNPLGSANMSGTACPKCGRHMPRCGVCSLWLGSTDPMARSRPSIPAANATGGAGTGAAREGDSRRALEDEVMKRFAAFCIRCNHGFHADHAREWFQKHRICPVAECNCICDR